jgi:Xaa-Pro aminopeptidase
MDAFDPEHFDARRRSLMDEIGRDAVIVLTANPVQMRSNDTHFPYRPSSDILYLTGFEQPEAVVVLAPGRDEGEFVMFVRPRDEEAERWSGSRPGPEGAEASYGADQAFAIDEIDDELPEILAERETLFYTFGGDDEFDDRVIGWLNELRHRRNEPPAAPRSVVDARDVLHEMRFQKRPEELKVMRRANRITSEAHVLAMRHCRPGMMEHELQSILEFHFQRHGADFPAYPSIVGSGDNATCLHYTDNDDRIEEGDVVLVDAGCELDYYAGDITRSFPASGEFAPAQRDVYQAVLAIQEEIIESIEPGLPFERLQERTVELTTEALLELGLLEGDAEEIVEEDEYQPYFPHKIGHWLGIDVHDVGPYYTEGGESRPLESGAVLTIEPGIYIPESDEDAPDEMRGLGIRIEDDILVTPEGSENLSSECPKSVDAIESLVGTSEHLFETDELLQ